MVSDDPRQPAEVFDRHVPGDFVHSTLDVIAKAYREAFERCDRAFEKPECHDLFPHQRRATIERNMRQLAYQSAGVEAIVAKNSRRTSYHTRIQCGRVVLTQSFVETPETIVRSAEFRKTYGRDQNLWLDYDWDDAAIPLPDQPLYAILIHGPSDVRRYLLGFAHIVFPSRSNEAYVGRIDLALRYPEVFEFSTVPVERVEDDVLPTLRRDVRKVEGQ